MTGARLALSREQILGFRRRVGSLDERLPPGAESLRQAAWAGLADSMPRAAVLSIHARVEGATPDIWEHSAFVQVWGPRYSAYVIATEDRAVFTLGRLPETLAARRRAERTADDLEAFLDGRTMTYGQVGHSKGVSPNSLRYAAPTGRVLIRWEGARQPTIWMVPAPAVDPRDARAELARRYLHVVGPGTPEGFARWAGVRAPEAGTTFADLAAELIPVETPIGEGSLLATDESTARTPASAPAGIARLLPSGDTFYLLQGRDRELLVPDPGLRGRLWTSRVWPGAVLLDGDIVGTWRRASALVTIEPWRRLAASERLAIEAEAAGLPVPGVDGGIRVDWSA